MSGVSITEFAEWAAEQYGIALIPTDRMIKPPIRREDQVVVAGVPGTWESPPAVANERAYVACPLLQPMPLQDARDLLRRISWGAWRYDGIKFGRLLAGDSSPQLGLFEVSA